MPTITYAGRITDSRKGLPIFLDALELLFSADLPPFRVRIVGGAEAEAASVEHTIHGIDTCRRAIENGRIEVWSRVERAALPELYSRSTVICVPSLREQFGMVAVEAMMCGTPVVASRIGGLQDLVVHDITGYLVDRLNPSALASALAQFVRNPKLGQWMGRNAQLWTTNRFDLESVTCRYVKLFENLMKGEQFHYDDESGPPALRQRMLEVDRPVVEELVGDPLKKWRDVSSSPTPSFIAETNNSSYFVKLHQERPPSLNCLETTRFTIDSISSERVKLARFLSTASVVPRVIAADEKTGILIQERLLEESNASDDEAEALMLNSSNQIQSIITVQGPEADEFLLALHRASSATEEATAIEMVDQAAMKLSAALLGMKPRLRRCHPQIELIRILNYLKKNPWAVGPDFGARVRSLLNFLIAERPLVCALPRLQHGSMKREHLMRRIDGTPAVCDLDHAGLYVGPHDIAHWFHEQHRRSKVAAPYSMLNLIHRLAQSEDDRFLGAIWLAIFPIFNGLWRFARGDWKTRLWDMQFLTAYPEAFRRVFTRSRESAAVR